MLHHTVKFGNSSMLFCKTKNPFEKKKKNALYLSVNVFSTKVLIGDTIFYEVAVLVRPRESNPRPPALQWTRSTDWANPAAVQICLNIEI